MPSQARSRSGCLNTNLCQSTKSALQQDPQGECLIIGTLKKLKVQSNRSLPKKLKRKGKERRYSHVILGQVLFIHLVLMVRKYFNPRDAYCH